MPKYGHKERWFTKSCHVVSCAMGTKSMVWNVSSFYVVDFGPVFWKFLFCLHFPVSSSFFSVWHKTGEFAGLWYSELPWCACEQSYKPVTANIMVIPLPRWVTGTISPYPEKRACCKGARASLITKMSFFKSLTLTYSCDYSKTEPDRPPKPPCVGPVTHPTIFLLILLLLVKYKVLAVSVT